MPAYGFRVSTFQSFKRKTRTAEDLGACGDEHAEVVYRVLKDQIGKQHSGAPDYLDLRGEVPLAGPGDPEFEVRSVSKVGRSVHVEVSMGSIGGHEDLITAAGTTPIHDDAAAQRFRVDFYFPKSGTKGVIVHEVRSRSSAQDHLISWLRRFEALEFPDDATDKNGYWRSIRTVSITDVGHLEELIKAASSTTVTFSAYSPPTTRGRGRKRGEMVVQDLDAYQAQALLREVERWLSGKKKNALTRAAKALGINMGKVKQHSLDFTRLAIKINGPEPVTVRPDNLTEVFTYPLSKDLRPSEDTWTSATGSKAAQLAAAETIDVEFE